MALESLSMSSSSCTGAGVAVAVGRSLGRLMPRASKGDFGGGGVGREVGGVVASSVLRFSCIPRVTVVEGGCVLC